MRTLLFVTALAATASAQMITTAPSSVVVRPTAAVPSPAPTTAGAPVTAGTSSAAAGANGSQQGRVDVGVVVPIDPHEHNRIQWFGRQDHGAVPGTVTIDKAPYVCDVHRRRFQDRDAFLAHLRADDLLGVDEIAKNLVVLDGVVHFSGAQ